MNKGNSIFSECGRFPVSDRVQVVISKRFGSRGTFEGYTVNKLVSEPGTEPHFVRGVSLVANLVPVFLSLFDKEDLELALERQKGEPQECQETKTKVSSQSQS